MDRSEKSKLALKAAEEMLRQPNLKPLLRAKLIELVLKHEGEQAKLAEERAQRRAAKEDQSAEIARLRQENKALRAELEALKAKQPEEPELDPTAAYFAQFRQNAASTPAGSVQQGVTDAVPAPAPASAPARLDPRLEFKSETIRAAIQPPAPSQTLRQVADATGNHTLKTLLGDKPSFVPSPAPRTASELSARNRQIAAADQTARKVVPVSPPDPLDRAIAELEPIPDYGDGGPMPSDGEYLADLRAGNAALDRVLAQPRYRPLVTDAIPDCDV